MTAVPFLAIGALPPYRVAAVTAVLPPIRSMSRVVVAVGAAPPGGRRLLCRDRRLDYRALNLASLIVPALPGRGARDRGGRGRGLLTGSRRAACSRGRRLAAVLAASRSHHGGARLAVTERSYIGPQLVKICAG